MAEQVASTSLYERAEHAARTIRARLTVSRASRRARQRLGGFADDFEDAVRIPYNEIPGFPRSTVEGHTDACCGKVDSVPVLAMQGRVHFYEGYSLEEVTFPIRTFKLLGIKTLVLTNAAGGINVQLTGALMVISDHVNLLGDNPLRGPNDDWSTFSGYVRSLLAGFAGIVVEEAKAIGAEVRRGIYGGLSGPSYETPAEIHLLRNLGATLWA